MLKRQLYLLIVKIISQYIKIYDEEGLYEKYSFSNLKNQYDFKDEEFSKDYSEYDF